MDKNPYPCAKDFQLFGVVLDLREGYFVTFESKDNLGHNYETTKWLLTLILQRRKSSQTKTLFRSDRSGRRRYRLRRFQFRRFRRLRHLRQLRRSWRKRRSEIRVCRSQSPKTNIDKRDSLTYL